VKKQGLDTLLCLLEYLIIYNTNSINLAVKKELGETCELIG